MAGLPRRFRVSKKIVVVSGSGPVMGDTQTEDQFVPIVVIKHRLHIRIPELRTKRVVRYRHPER